MATALDDLLEAFPNGWAPADSAKKSGPSLSNDHTNNGASASNDLPRYKPDAPNVSTGQQAKVPLNDINLFDEPISELGDHEPLVMGHQANNTILPPKTTTPTKWVVNGDHNPAEDILTSLLYPEKTNGRDSHVGSTKSRGNVESAPRRSSQEPSRQAIDPLKRSPPRAPQPPIANGRASARAGLSPASIEQASSSKLLPSGYGYTPPSAISPKGSIRISGIAKAVEAQRQEEKLRRKEEKRRSQETVVDTPSSSATTGSTSQASPDDFLAREPSDSSDEGWIDAATYNARKGWRRPNVSHSVQDEEEDAEDTYVPEKRKPDMWSQQDVEVEKMEQARIVTERTQKMQLLDFEVAPEPENIVPAWRPSTRSSNRYPAPQEVPEARPPNTFKALPRQREPDLRSYKSAHWADEDDQRGSGHGIGRGRGHSPNYKGNRGRGSRSSSTSPETSLSGSNAIPVSRDPEARLRAASDWIQPRIQVPGPFQDQYRSAWEAQRKGITNPRSGRGRGAARY